jgi:hypothetical protein
LKIVVLVRLEPRDCQEEKERLRAGKWSHQMEIYEQGSAIGIQTKRVVFQAWLFFSDDVSLESCLCRQQAGFANL